jgi:hypothetical protein
VLDFLTNNDTVNNKRKSLDVSAFPESYANFLLFSENKKPLPVQQRL